METKCPPKWHYVGPNSASKNYKDGDDGTRFPDLTGEFFMDLGSYCRLQVSNLDCIDGQNLGRKYFDMGLRHILSYQHEIASKCLIAALHFSPYCALAHALVALCHCPNYNFKGDAYYESTHHPDELNQPDHLCVFPSQQVADRHSKASLDIVEQIRRIYRRDSSKRKKKTKGKRPVSEKSEIETKDSPTLISEVELSLISAVRILTCNPGIDSGLSEELVGRPYADALRKVYERFPHDPEIAYFFTESLMVLNAWKLYEYPTGKPLSDDVVETRAVLETSLKQHSDHAGLCHLYVHLMEMSSEPSRALDYCGPLRNNFKMAGHLIHMPTHIDVLIGDYEACVHYNCLAIEADMFSMHSSPDTAGTQSFYFGYIAHNYHFAVYGAILGGMEYKAYEIAAELSKHLTEDLFIENPDLSAYLESYSALDIHVMVRFGRWNDILELKYPNNQNVMFFRSATLTFARGLAYANTGAISSAKCEADQYVAFVKNPIAESRILHNNLVNKILEVDVPMLLGEIAYHERRYSDAFDLLRLAVRLQDNLNFDEPWGKMQPIRHALGGLLLEQSHLVESMEVFRKDLELHPNNPFALVGLIECLERQSKSGLLEEMKVSLISQEIQQLRSSLEKQRKLQWADFEIKVACACCTVVLPCCT